MALAVFQDVADDHNDADGQVSDWKNLKALRAGGDPAKPIGPEWLRERLTETSAPGGVTLLASMTAVTAGGLAMAGKRRQALLTVGKTQGANRASVGGKRPPGRRARGRGESRRAERRRRLGRDEIAAETLDGLEACVAAPGELAATIAQDRLAALAVTATEESEATICPSAATPVVWRRHGVGKVFLDR